MQKRLLFLSFIEGAAVMAAELCGAKLLAPVFGSSLYVWASVMGITLAALAGGYFFGGWIAGRHASPAKNLLYVLVAASLFLLLMPLISHYLVPRISYLPFLAGMVTGTVTLLFLPVFFLGASSPLFISLQSAGTDAGKVSGTVYAVSTAGGIFATFLCGFYLIPEAGLQLCLLCFGGALLVASLVIFKFLRSFYPFLALACVYLNLQFAFKKDGQLLVSDGILGHLEVLDAQYADGKTVRLLRVNNIIQTEMDLATHRSVSDYVRLLDTLIPRSTKKKNALVLGLGGGLTANLLEEKNYAADGVELDRRIIASAGTYFYLDPRVSVIEADARYFLNSCSKRYAVVIVDVFKAEEQPSHVLTLESLDRLKQNLDDSALVLINWHGYNSPGKGQGTTILYNTLRSAGFQVRVCSLLTDEDRRNLVFAASLTPIHPLPFELQERFAETARINTDNLPLLEKYNAAANAAWRINYLRFYQR